MILEQIHIPFAPQLAATVDISNHIVESGFVGWITKNWQVLLACVAFILFVIWANGGFDKKVETKEEPKPTPTQ